MYVIVVNWTNLEVLYVLLMPFDVDVRARGSDNSADVHAVNKLKMVSLLVGYGLG